MRSLDGKVAVITGGASGIGLAMARCFGREGMRVAIADVEPGSLSTAAAALLTEGIDARGVETDVGDPASVERLRETVMDELGAVHVLCNNAGVLGAGLAWDVTVAQWEWVLGVNLMGVVNGIRSFVPHLIAQGEGHIVNTASSSGLVPNPLAAPYNASKAAVVALSETLFHDLRSVGVTGVGVSVVCPSFVATQIVDCDRNAPQTVRSELAAPGERRERLEGMRELWRGLLAAGLDPAEVADAVLDAVREDRFYVITHEATLAAARSRFDHILRGEVPVANVG